jgi:hypothetical protein
MRTFDRRLNKLEYDLGISKAPRLLVVVSAAAKELALDHDACIRILDEAGHLAPSGPAVVHLCDIPDGLSPEETKRYLREHAINSANHGETSLLEAVAAHERNSYR